MSIETIMNSISSDIVIVKDGAGNVYWPAFGVNNIGNMKPGEGYQIKMKAPRTLTYPANSLTKSSKNDSLQYHQHNVYYHLPGITNNNCVVGIPDRLLRKILHEGDEIAITDLNGSIYGTTIYNGNNTAITVWGDDLTTTIKDGMAPNENYLVRLYCGHKNEEISISDFEMSEGKSFYEANSINVIGKFRLTQIVNSNTQGFIVHQNYPNPFNPTTEIRFELPEEGLVTITIFNILGQTVSNILPQSMDKGEHIIKWEASSLPGGIYIYEVQYVSRNYNSVEVNKMLLIK